MPYAQCFITSLPTLGVKSSGSIRCCISEAPPSAPKLATWASEAAAKHVAIDPPHAGSYYMKRRPRPPFFEGWFLRVVLPGSPLSYGFMFSIEADGTGSVQLLAPDDHVHTVVLPREQNGRFDASTRVLEINHWEHGGETGGQSVAAPDSKQLEAGVTQGYHMSKTSSHGKFSGEHGDVQWALEYDAVLSWGERGKQARSTGTWLAHLPVFDPGYQVLMGHGVAKKGYISVNGERKDVQGAVVYAEKNWGSSFPSKWWWTQANDFEAHADLSVTALGAIRGVLWFEEVVGMVCVHYKGKMYEFANWTFDSLKWEVQPWGSWQAWSEASTGHFVHVVASTREQPVEVLGPSDDGMVPNILDNSRGCMIVTLLDADGVPILKDVKCNNAHVEVGGGPWEDKWVADTKRMPQPLRGLVNMFNRPRVQTSP